MSDIVSNPSEASDAVTADKMQLRRPLWPAFVLALAMIATLFWTGTLVWFLSRVLFLIFID